MLGPKDQHCCLHIFLLDLLCLVCSSTSQTKCLKQEPYTRRVLCLHQHHRLLHTLHQCQIQESVWHTRSSTRFIISYVNQSNGPNYTRRVLRLHQHHRSLRTLHQCQIQESVWRSKSSSLMLLWRNKVRKITKQKKINFTKYC